MKVETKHIYAKGKVTLTVPQYDGNATLTITDSGQFLSLSAKELAEVMVVFKELIRDIENPKAA